MDMLIMGLVTLACALWAWRVLPVRISDAHERFRQTGTVQVASHGLAIEASICEWSDKATFVLVMPRIHSRATVCMANGELLKLQATTCWPSMATRCALLAN